MTRESQFPPLLLAKATALYWQRRVHFPKELYGSTVSEEEKYLLFRKVVVEPADNQPLMPQAQFKVCFRFARFSPNVNKLLSLIPIPFIIAQPGFRSKIWMTGLETGTFHGLYEWDSIADAECYWSSFPMKLMKSRSIPETLKYEITEL